MSVTIQVTYDMGKELGAHRFEVDVAEAPTVADVVRVTRERFGAERGEKFEALAHRAAVAVNGVLASYKRGRRTKLADGDKVSFVKAAAGG